jgi:hypothetical protein
MTTKTDRVEGIAHQMSNHSTQIVQKLWNYCNILRDDGLSYGDYVEQLTFLLFLKMADEQSRPPFNKPSPMSWVSDLGCSDSSSAKRRTRFKIRPSCAGWLPTSLTRKNGQASASM